MLAERAEIICRVLIKLAQPEDDIRLFTHLSGTVLTDVANRMRLEQYRDGEDIIGLGLNMTERPSTVDRLGK